VLTWLKRDLLLSNKDTIPANVRLLAIDTATRLEAGASRITASGAREEAAVVGGVSLDESEFIYIGGDSRPIAERVKNGKLGQIGQWYHAKKWLDSQAPATFILDDGAGRLRQFGRMAVFKDILGQEAGSRLWRSLRTAIQSVRNATNEQRKLEIIVVGSFAGGTGSGMFIDVALLLRVIAQQLGVHHVLRGFFALPSVFTNAPDAEMKARSFAAWRELNRFMVVNSDFPMPLIEYVENNPAFRIRPDQRIFDACYLIDGTRKGAPIAEEAKFGVFPMLSESISAILDEEAGTAYTQWVFTNLAPEYAKNPETPMYSAIGAYTVQVPAHFVQQVSGHQFAREVLLKLLSPQVEPDKEDRLPSADAARHLLLASPNRNLEDRTFAGRSRSRQLLRSAAAYASKAYKPTRYHGRIAELVEQATDAAKRASTVDILARAGGSDIKSPAAAASWVSFFPDLGDDQQFDGVRKSVMEHMNFSIIQSYSRREGEKEDETRARFRKIPEDLRTRFGGITSSGEEIEDYYGGCGDALAKCQQSQLQMFRQIVRAQLLATLMGQSDDAIVARSGKIGYAWDYFDGLSAELEEFLKLMREVKLRREELKPELKLAGLSDRAKRFMDSVSGKKIFWIFEHPDVKGTELAYLQAQQRLMELRREDILHTYVVETAREMKAICQDVCGTLQRWIWQLATGDDASQVPGLWDGVRDSLNMVKSAHSFDTQSKKVQMLVGNQALTVSEEDLKNALKRLEWDADFSGETPKLHVRLVVHSDTPGANGHGMSDPWMGDSEERRRDIAHRNLLTLLGLTSERFAGVVASSTVADEIKRRFPQPKKFVDEIAQVSAEPLFEGDPQAHSKRSSNLIRVMTADGDTYFSGANGVEGELRSVNHVDRATRDDMYGIQVVKSENPYKLTLVRTDDLYLYDQFAAWEAGQAAYAGNLQEEGQPLDPVLMHNFAAEARSVEYERRLMRPENGGHEYQPLHPRVVMLLENPVALRQFIYLGILGMIVEKETHGSYHWQLTWTKSTGDQIFWLTRGWNADQDATRAQKPDIFNAAHGYVIMQRTQELGRRDTIDFEFAQRLIDKRMVTIGQAEQMRMLRENLDGGIISWLKERAYDPDVPTRVQHKDYADLATIIEMMINDEIRRLQGDKQQPGSPGGGAFKVYQAQSATAAGPAPTSMTDSSAILNGDVDVKADADDHEVNPFGKSHPASTSE
jgi:hypothetical protein